MDKPAQERKRKASTALRALAADLQVEDRGRNNDMTKVQSTVKHLVVYCPAVLKLMVWHKVGPSGIVAPH
jgi:hypothetical protein